MVVTMQNATVTREKRPFRITLLYFVLGVAVLVAISFSLASFLPEQLAMSRQKIGVVEVQGVIIDGRHIVRQLAKYRKDPSIKGIILRINSPGGAVAPAQEIYTEVLKTRKEKKIIASMGSLAASGGYYIASPVHLIVANPGTLTGSIGVIMASSNIQELMDKIGLKPQVIKSGEFKDTGSPMRPMSPKEREILQKVVDDVHQQFVEVIAKGRNMPIEEVEKLADGRIFTGRQALALNLVDQLGSFEDSVDLLADMLGMTKPPKLVQEQETQSLLDWLLQGLLPQRFINTIVPYSFPTLQYLWYWG